MRELLSKNYSQRQKIIWNKNMEDNIQTTVPATDEVVAEKTTATPEEKPLEVAPETPVETPAE